MTRRYLHFFYIGLAGFLPSLAFAHSEHEGTSFVGGFLHPLLGPDHLLAMLSVGIISALIGGRALFRVPAAFVACMLLGGTMGIFGIALPHVESGIALSVLLLGAGIAMPQRCPACVTMCAVGFFGILHGNAHGVEMPQAAVPVFYSLGFIISTSLIHIAGVGIGFIPFLHGRNRLPMGLAGCAISVVGIYFLVQPGL